MISYKEAIEHCGQGCGPFVKGDYGYALRRMLAERAEDRRVIVRDGDGVATDDGPFSDADVDVRMAVGYKTKEGRVAAEITVDGFYMHRDEVPLLTSYERLTACTECKGSNGGCPGFSPYFATMRPTAAKVFFVAVHMDFIHVLKFKYPNDPPQNRKFRRMMYADRLLSHYIERLRRDIVSRLSGSVGLSIGNCSGCNTPKDCAIIRGGRCAHPKRRVFSVESVGIDCDDLHHMMYGDYLPWFYPYYPPPVYTSRYIMIFHAGRKAPVDALAQAVRQDRSYVSARKVPVKGTLPKVLAPVPDGSVHAGYRLYVYNDPLLALDKTAEKYKEIFHGS